MPTDLKLPALTSEYIRVEVSATLEGAPVDPTSDDVELAFVERHEAPVEDDWQAATWETDTTTNPDTHYARAIPDPLDPGIYSVWIRVTDDPEIVVRECANALVIDP